mmetsp:Transcript_71740/g.119971  ORF Transcript_71740/g.119971 Transcript_71740/m.119971 type:complete len:201 (-) Transcript_71740:944-1546(-)
MRLCSNPNGVQHGAHAEARNHEMAAWQSGVAAGVHVDGCACPCPNARPTADGGDTDGDREDTGPPCSREASAERSDAVLGSAHVSGMCGACEAHSLSQASGSPRGRAHHTIRSSASDSNILTLSFSSRRGEEVIAHLDKVKSNLLEDDLPESQLNPENRILWEAGINDSRFWEMVDIPSVQMDAHRAFMEAYANKIAGLF